LEILEYCLPEDVIKREQYYMDILQPEYNILRVAGSSFGYKHSDEARSKMSTIKQGSNHSDETRKKMSEAKIGNTNSKNQPNSQQIEVIDIQNNTTTSYDSMGEAARALNLPNFSIIRNYILLNQQKPYKGRYSFKKK